jgi:hypothetical protein
MGCANLVRRHLGRCAFEHAKRYVIQIGASCEVLAMSLEDQLLRAPPLQAEWTATNQLIAALNDDRRRRRTESTRQL